MVKQKSKKIFFIFQISIIFSESLLTPKEFLGYELGDKFSFHHDAVNYFKHVSKTVEHVNDQRKRRNAISKYAGFPPPIIKGADDQQVLEDLYRTLTVQDPPIGTTPKEKLHDQLHQKINGARAQNDVSFKSGGVLIDGEFAYFKFVNYNCIYEP